MDNKTIANIKSLSIDMIDNAKSGHPGIVLSAAPILYTLYKYHLNINPKDTTWYNRDRFIMSAGHGSALLYATLYMSGFDIDLDDLKKFREIDSITPGHPEYGVTPGVECSTGPLGQGVATSVGIALGGKILRSRLSEISKEYENKIDFNTYVLVGDGDLMEGVSYEALSLAGTLGLDNLIILYDSNNTTLDGSTNNTFKDNIKERFSAIGFDTFKVKDGNNIGELNVEINKAKKSKKPSIIEVKTHLGYGSLLQDDHKVHGSCLLEDDIKQLKEKLSIPLEKFYVDFDKKEDLNSFIARRVGDKYFESIDFRDKILMPNIDTKYKDIKFLFSNTKYDISSIKWIDQEFSSLRDANKYVLNCVSKINSEILTGSADLNSSTKVYLDDEKDITPNNFNGKNIWYGVREHAMGAISNGLSLVGFTPVASTFLVFSDYLRPAIRMSALMNLPVIYTFTHDSVSVGKDGPTHEPVEQLSSLRAISNLDVYRPANLKELIGTYQAILNNKKPSAIVISRNKGINIEGTSATKSMKGGYTVLENDNAVCTLVATGTELAIAKKIALALVSKNINVRVVSMVSLDVFLRQSKQYKDKVLKDMPKIVIEAGSYFGWGRITNFENIISIDSFGFSGSSEDVLKRLKFSEEEILNKILKILKK